MIQFIYPLLQKAACKFTQGWYNKAENYHPSFNLYDRSLIVHRLVV